MKKNSQSNTKSRNVKKLSVLKDGNLTRTDPKRDLENKRSLWLEDYQDFFTRVLQPVSLAFLDRLGCELIEFCEDPDIELLRLDAFFVKKRIHPDTGRNWAKKYEDFGKVYRTCKIILGMRRENGAMRQGWNASVVMGTMGIFDDEYRELKEWENKVKTDMLNSGTKMVLIPSHFEEKKKEE
jgi:hypothetical protein